MEKLTRTARAGRRVGPSRFTRGLNGLRRGDYLPRPVAGARLRRNPATATPPSSSGLGYLVLSQETGVRFPVGVLGGPHGPPCEDPVSARLARASLVWKQTDIGPGRLAQLVEHYAHIVGVAGSSPAATIPHGTPPLCRCRRRPRRNGSVRCRHLAGPRVRAGHPPLGDHRGQSHRVSGNRRRSRMVPSPGRTHGRRPNVPGDRHPGGFTTFSAFGLETVSLLRAGAPGLATANLALQVGGGLLAVWVGWALLS